MVGGKIPNVADLEAGPVLEILTASKFKYPQIDDRVFLDKYKFPLSYRYLMATFGYGLYMDMFVLFRPEHEVGDSVYGDGLRVRQYLHDAIEEEYLEYYPAGDETTARNLYPFAMSENGHYLAWELDESRFSRSSEWPVWVVGPRMGGLTLAAPDLIQFFSGVSSSRVKEMMGPGHEPFELVFEGLPKDQES